MVLVGRGGCGPFTPPMAEDVDEAQMQQSLLMIEDPMVVETISLGITTKRRSNATPMQAWALGGGQEKVEGLGTFGRSL